MTNTLTQKWLEKFREKFVHEIFYRARDKSTGQLKGYKRLEVSAKQEEIEAFITELIEDVRREKVEEIVEEYGDFRLIEKGALLIKYGRTLRFYLFPHTKHKKGDDESSF